MLSTCILCYSCQLIHIATAPGFQQALGMNTSCSAVNQEESKTSCLPRKAFSAMRSLSLIVKVAGSFNRKPPYCSVSAVAAPLASVCVAVAFRMFSPLSFSFSFGGLSKAARCSCFLAFVTSERTLIAYGIVRMTDNVFDWSLARWIEEISELKPQESSCVPVLEERGRPAGPVFTTHNGFSFFSFVCFVASHE